jgi:hypothetical protein
LTAIGPLPSTFSGLVGFLALDRALNALRKDELSDLYKEEAGKGSDSKE